MEINRFKLEQIVGEEYILHIQVTNWGYVFFITKKDGNGFARAFIMKDNVSDIYLEWLGVSDNSRNKKIGTTLQIIRENIGRELGCLQSYLWVVKDTWMKDWYERRGYSYYSEYEKENAIWMIKSL